MNIPVILFTIISAILFCVLFVVVIRLSFDRVGNHISRTVIGILLLVACAIFWFVTIYEEEKLAFEIHADSCSYLLTLIHSKAMEYRASEGVFPANLLDIVRRTDLAESQLHCPSTRGEYRLEQLESNDPSLLLCHDPAPHRFRVFWFERFDRRILFADGRIETVSEERFEELVEEQARRALLSGQRPVASDSR